MRGEIMEFLKFLESIRSPELTNIAYLFTTLGEELIVITVLCTIYWCINKSLAYKISFTYFISGLLVQSLKITFRIERPWILDPTFHPVDKALETATGYSFPSGHTQSGTSLFASLAFHFKRRWIQALCVITFVLIGMSRMYLGVHTPQDVLVSMGLTLLISYLIHRYMTQSLQNNKNNYVVSIIAAIISIGVIIYSITLLINGSITENYAADCIKGAGAGLGFSVGFYLERKYINFSTETDHIWQQVLKILLGLGMALLLKSGIKAVFGENLIISALRYFLLILWILVIYPMIIKRFYQK